MGRRGDRAGQDTSGPLGPVKTDRKDAELLARLLPAGSLTRVVVPPVDVEAARELPPAHHACRRDLMRVRHRVSKMLLRHGRATPAFDVDFDHRRWLVAQQFEEPASELAFADLLAGDGRHPAHARRRSRSPSRLAQDEQWWPTIARLRCFRGVDTLTAFALHIELGGDWQRFHQASSLSAWLGLVPSLQQSGESSRQGSITKTGSTFARRLLCRVGLALRARPHVSARPCKTASRAARSRPADR